MADGTIRVIIDPAGAVSGEQKVRRSLDGVNKAGKQAQGQATKTASSFKALTTSLIGPVGVVAGLAAVAAGLKATVAIASKFQKSISELSAITGATGDDLEFLSDQAKLLGRTTTLSASEVAEGFKLIASAKPDLLESGEALTEVTTQAITLAEAAGITLPQAAIALGGALNQFQADADQASRFINVLAAGSQKGASEIPELTQALKTAGTVAAGAGLSFETTIAAIETLAEVNLKGAEAGTNLRNVILRLQKEGVDQLNPKVVGLTTALRNLASEQRTDVELLKLFGTESFAAASALLARTDRTDALEKAITGTLTAEEQALINTDNLDGKTKALSSAIEGLGIAFGTILLPAVEDTTSFFTIYINQMTDALEETIKFSTGISQAFGDAADTPDSFIRNIADKSIKEIEDRIREENQVLNTLLDESVGTLALLGSRQTFGISSALAQGEIEDLERFIALLKKARDEANEAQDAASKVQERLGQGIVDKATFEFNVKFAKGVKDLADAQKKAADEAEKAAQKQEASFQRLAGSLIPIEKAQKDLEAAEAILNKQRELGLITGEQLFDLQLRLRGAFEDAIDPLEALNDKLEEETELAKLTTEQKAVEVRVRQELDDLKRAGVDVTEEQSEAIRKEIENIQVLTEAQSMSKETQKELNEEAELQKTILEELRGPQEDLNDRVAALTVLLDDGKISLDEFNEKLGDLRAQSLAGQTSVEAGFERGFIKAQENLNDFASLSEKVVTDAFGGMEEGIVNFAKTGKFEFSSLVDTILEDIVRLEARRALSSFFGKAAGAGGEGGSGLFGVASSFFNQGGGEGGGSEGGSGAADTSGFAGIAGQLAAAFASNQDGGIETRPTVSKIAEAGPEAIIPLKGGSVPVEISQDRSTPPAIINNTFNISTPDPGAFNRSTGQIGNMVGQSFQRSIQRNG